MKKLIVLFMLLVPLNVFALEISDITISSPSEMKQGEYNTINIDVKFDNVPNGTIIMGAGIEINYDNLMLTIEEMTAENSEIYYEGPAGHRDIVGILTFDEDEMSFETECINGAFCKTYRFSFKVYPRVAGIINFKVLSAGGIFYDMSKLPEFKDEDIIEIEIEKEVEKQINVIASSTPIETPSTTIPTTTKTIPAVINPPKIPKTTTFSSTTTILTTSTLISTEKASENNQNQNEKSYDLKEEKEKVAKINKKIFLAVGIIVIVIIFIIIINIIISKINNKKINEALKKL